MVAENKTRKEGRLARRKERRNGGGGEVEREERRKGGREGENERERKGDLNHFTFLQFHSITGFRCYRLFTVLKEYKVLWPFVESAKLRPVCTSTDLHFPNYFCLSIYCNYKSFLFRHKLPLNILQDILYTLQHESPLNEFNFCFCCMCISESCIT